MSDFGRCVTFVIDDLEGGDKVIRDSGGATKWGISERAHPHLDIEQLTRQEALEIYEREYWSPPHCGNLPWPRDLVIFDCAVNQGISAAIDIEHAAIDAYEAIILRIERYVHLCNVNERLRPNLRGWMNRMMKVWREAKV